MAATLDGVTKKKKAGPTAEQAAALELARMAREPGLSLTGPEGSQVPGHLVPRLRRRDPPAHLLDQRDRIPERQVLRRIKARGHLPQRAVGVENLYLVTW